MKNFLSKYTLVLLSALLTAHAHATVDPVKNSSIQGGVFADRKNGIFDSSISDEEVTIFLDALKKAVQQDNPKEVAKLISYPCRWNTKKEHKVLKTEKDFLKYYKCIMQKSLKELIEKTQTGDLFVNYQGFMIGNGEIWFDPRKGIKTFNTL